MNLPGDLDYEPGTPWVSKVCLDGSLACDLSTYIDDGRTSGSTRDKCWKASKRTASVLNHLGLQDAPRKRRKPSLNAGPWQGLVVFTDNDCVAVTVMQERWNKFKDLLNWVKLQAEERTEFYSASSFGMSSGIFYLSGSNLYHDGPLPQENTPDFGQLEKKPRF